MAEISYSGPAPSRKRLSDVACRFSDDYRPSCDTDAAIARKSGLTETEIVFMLDCIAEHGGLCSLGDLAVELGEARLLAKVMAVVAAGYLCIDHEALEDAGADEPYAA
ncbi:hypothetical protein [Salinarimonas ramus]|uniref:Uncharacterized protein n=1 Tax=Salinarimonas ramus TaxID=690164 RepID=A0A917QF72_9HYPH|nr:hypothetical protein [Salinarimonas ramus]GGK47697.1 hypothetical protein GCM10011322_38440 [Salinarimonas ramus]